MLKAGCRGCGHGPLPGNRWQCELFSCIQYVFTCRNVCRLFTNSETYCMTLLKILHGTNLVYRCTSNFSADNFPTKCPLWTLGGFGVFFSLTSLDFFGLSRLFDMEEASAGKQVTPFDKLQRTTFFKIPPTSPGGAPPRRCIATYIGFLTVFVSPE